MRKSYQGDDYRVGRINYIYHSDVSAAGTCTPAQLIECQVHASIGQPFQGVHVHAIGGGTSEQRCGHQLLCRQPV